MGENNGSSRALTVGVARSVGVTQAKVNVSAAAVTLGRLNAFCDALSKNLSMRVEARQTKNYEELARDVESGKADIAWLPPVVALNLVSLGRALPVSLPVRRGSATFYTALFVRSDSRFNRVDDLREVRAAWVDPSSASGYLVMRAALRSTGRRPAQIFSREHFEGSHEAVVRAVLDGRADVGATFCHRDRSGLLVSAGWGNAEVRVLMDYGPIPADLIAASITLPGSVIQRVRLALSDDVATANAARELFEAERFVRAEATHLAPLERLLTHLDDAVPSRASLIPPRR